MPSIPNQLGPQNRPSSRAGAAAQAGGGILRQAQDERDDAGYLGVPASPAGAVELALPGQRRSAALGGSEPHQVGSVGAVYHWPVRVYWEDTDAGGIVFYANYLKFFERSRTEWLRSLGIEQQTLKNATGCMFVVAEATVRYHRPARLDDELIVTASLQETGRASMIIKQQALLKTQQPGEQSMMLLCEGSIRIGWVDSTSLQPRRIPASILNRLNNPVINPST